MIKKAFNNETVSLYMKDINRIPLLTRDEEIELAQKAAAGDTVAKNRIVNANLRFVVSVAKRYQNRGLDFSDLISEGNIGLLNAIEHFDVSKGYHFISYAVWWIRQSILKALSEKTRMIRLPLNRANEIVQIEKTRKMLMKNLGEEEELKEIGAILNMDKDFIRDMLNISKEMVSLDTIISVNDKEGSSLGDFIEDTMHERPEEIALRHDLENKIDEVLGTLSDREADIIRYRFGLGGLKAMSLKEVGVKFNLTKERIRQIEKKAIKQLQHPRRAAQLEAFVA